MKKIFILAALLFFASPVFAAPWDDSDTHKCVVLNASIWEVEQTVTDLIKAYDGVVTPRKWMVAGMFILLIIMTFHYLVTGVGVKIGQPLGLQKLHFQFL